MDLYSYLWCLNISKIKYIIMLCVNILIFIHVDILFFEYFVLLGFILIIFNLV